MTKILLSENNVCSVATYVIVCYSLGTRLHVLALETMCIWSYSSQRIVCLIIVFSSALTSDQSCHQRGGKGPTLPARKARRAANTLGTRTSKVPSEWRWPDCGVSYKHGVLLDQRFFLSRVQKLDAKIFCSSSFAPIFSSWNFISWNLQHQNFPIDGTPN